MANTNDWLVANLNIPNATHDDFQANNVNPENTTLKDKDYYKASPVVQDMFTDKTNGRFDEGQYNQYYDSLLYSYNEFAKDDYLNKAVDSFEYNPYNSYAPKDGKIETDLYKVEKIKNPFKQKIGIEGFNVTSKPEYSIREVAQMNKVRDGISGEALDWTPNDDDARGLWDFWKKPTLVLGQYDKEGEHYDAQAGRKVKHVAGDYKTDENGDFFYETLGDRESYNKDVLSWADTLTKEGDYSNKYDFMDSDGIDKSIAGIITKMAVKAVPLFIPYVGQIYAAGIIGTELMDVAPMLLKSGASLFVGDADVNKDYWKKLNKVQSLAQSMSSGSMSDYAQSNMISVEGLGGMVGDIFSQLYTQRVIANIPNMIGMSKRAAQGAEGVYEVFGKTVGDKMVQGTLSLAEKTQILEKVPEAATFINRKVRALNLSKGLATTYMSATSAASITAESKKLGLDERDTGAMFLGTTLGFFGMMRAIPIGEWALQGIGMEDGAVVVRNTVKDTFSALKPALERETKEVIKKGTRYQQFFERGKSLGKTIAEKMSHVEDYKGAMLSEGAEEISEEFMQDGIRTVYNGLNSLGLVSTDKGNDFQYGSLKDMAARYGMAGLGGAFGGILFHLNDHMSSEVGKDKGTKKELAYLVRNGYTDQILKHIDKTEKQGGFGSTSLSVEPVEIDLPGLGEKTVFKPATEVGTSQNAVIANLMRKHVQNLNNQIFQEGAVTDIALSKILDARTDLITDLKVNSPLFEDFNNVVNEIISLKDKVAKAAGEVTEESPVSAVEASALKVRDLNTQLFAKREELKQITSGEKFLDYQKYALFGISPFINRAFVNLSLDDYAMNSQGTHYNGLTEEQKKTVSAQYKVWEKLEAKDKIKEGYKRFTYMNEKFSESLRDIAVYADQREGHYSLIDIQRTFNAPQPTVPGQEPVEPTFKDRGTLKTLSFLSKNTMDILAQYKSYLNRNIYLNSALNALPINPLEERLDAKNEILNIVNNPEFQRLDAAMVRDMRGIMTSFSLSDLDLDKIAYSLTKEPATMDEDGNYMEGDSKTLGFGDNTLEQIAGEIFTERVSDLEKLRDKYLEKARTESTDPDVDKKTINEFFDQLINSEAAVKNTQDLAAFDAVTKSKSIDTLNELLKKFAIIQDGKPSDIITLVISEFDSIEKLERMTEYEINKPDVMENLEYAMNLLAQVVGVMSAATDYNYKRDGFNGYNNVVNNSFKESNLGTISQSQFTILAKEITMVGEKIDFLITLAKINAEDKIKDNKEAGLNMEAMFYEQLTADKPLFKLLDKISVDGDKFLDASITDALSSASALQGIIASKRGDVKKSLPSSKEDLLQFEIQRNNIQQALYSRVQSLIAKNASKGGKEYVFNKLFGIDANGVMSKDVQEVFTPIALSHPELTDFSSTSVTIQPLDVYIWLNTSFMVNPAEFINALRGNEVSPGHYDGVEDSAYAPFYSQEYSVKVAFGAVADPAWMNMALSKIGNTDGAFLPKIMKPLLNAVYADGLPGAGKTTAFGNTLSKILKMKNISFWAAAPHIDQANQLQESVEGRADKVLDKAALLKAIVGNKNQSGLVDEIMAITTMDSQAAKNSKYVEKAEDTYFLPKEDGLPTPTNVKGLISGVDYKKFIFWQLNKVDTSLLNGDAERKNLPDVIFIDEATHFSNLEQQLIQQTFANMSNPPVLVMLGDTRQNGALINNEKHNLNLFHTWRTPKLGSSLRNSNNHKRKNLIGLVALYNEAEKLYRKVEVNAKYTYTNVITDLKRYTQNPASQVKFSQYTSDEGIVFGEKLIKPNELNVLMLKKMASTSDGKIGFITDNLESKIVKEIEADPILNDKFVIKSTGKVQGLEFDNVIVDVNWEKFTSDANFGILNLISNLYTLTSRSKSGTIITDNGLSANPLFSITQIDEKDVLPTELDPKLVKEYKDGRVAILNELAKQFPFDQAVKSEKTPSNSGASTVSPTTPEVGLLSNIFTELQSIERVRTNPGEVVRSYESDPNKYTNNKIVTYPFYERWGAFETQPGKWNLGEANEDMGYLLSVTSGAPEQFITLRKKLKNIKTALFYYKDVDMVQKLIGEMDESLQFGKARVVVRASKYDSNFDRTHTSNYDSKKENKNEPFIRLALEIPRVDGDTGEELDPVYFTLAPFSSLQKIKETKKGSNLEKKFTQMVTYLTEKIKDGPVNLVVDKDNSFDAIEVMTNAQLRYIKDRTPFDDVKSVVETGLASPTYLITSHPPIKDTDGESDFVQWAKDRKLIGRTVYFSTFDPEIKDPTLLKDMYIEEMIENRKRMKDGVAIADLPIPRIKLVVLDEAGYEPSEWISNIMDEARKPRGAGKPLGLSSSPEMAARIYNSLLNMVAITSDKIANKMATDTEKVLNRGGKEILKRVHEMFGADPLVVDTLKHTKYQEAKIVEINKIITGLTTEPTAKTNGVGMRYNFKYNHTYRLLIALGIAIEGGMENNKHYPALGEFAGPALKKQLFDGLNEYLKQEYPHGIFTHAIYSRRLEGKPSTTPITDYVEIASGDFTTNVVPTMFDSILDLDSIVTEEEKNSSINNLIIAAKEDLKQHALEASTNVESGEIDTFMKDATESIEKKSFENMTEGEIAKEIKSMKSTIDAVAETLKPVEILPVDIIEPDVINKAIEDRILIPEIQNIKLDKDSIVYNKTTKRFDFKAENSTFVVEAYYDPASKNVQVVTKAPKFEPPTLEKMTELQTNLGEGIAKIIQDNPKNAELKVLLTYIQGDRDTLIEIAEGVKPNVNYENATDILMSPKHSKVLEMLKEYITTTDNNTCKS